jgi:hypothetical protein
VALLAPVSSDELSLNILAHLNMTVLLLPLDTAAMGATYGAALAIVLAALLTRLS